MRWLSARTYWIPNLNNGEFEKPFDYRYNEAMNISRMWLFTNTGDKFDHAQAKPEVLSGKKSWDA